jgi:hypothetical protein
MVIKSLLALVAGLVLTGCGNRPVTEAQAVAQPAGKLSARTLHSGFPLAHDTYNGMGCASDGKIYYVLCTDSLETGAQMYSYDPVADKIRHLGDLTEAAGEKGLEAIPQGKSHVNFVESNGKLYFATHVGYYTIQDGMERMGVPPKGYKPYPGGHFLAYDLASGRFENLVTAPAEQGIITMNMDTKRGRLYGITWPNGYFLRYDLRTRELKNLGAISHEGESGRGPTYRTLCRSLAVDPEDGSVYFSIAEGTIFRYRYDRDAIETVQGDDLRRDYFGLYDPTSAGHMAYNWRQTVWYAPEKAVYGVHGNSGYLFRLDPRAEQVEVLDRITSEPSRRSGMFDEFSYGYLGFTLGPDGRTIYYLTGGPIYENGRRVAGKSDSAKGESKGRENLHLVTYDIPQHKSTDHGPIFLEDGRPPSYVNSIAVGKDGSTYAISRLADGHSDLIRIPPVR